MIIIAGLIFNVCFGNGFKQLSESECDTRIKIDSGWVCGSIREADYGVKYASFRGIPYAQQPLGNLRFKELQPAEPWSYLLDATKEGPVCPQDDVFYDGLVDKDREMSESCIRVNVHVPIDVMTKHQIEETGYPVLVFIHGGAYSYGSGDSDLHGPEYFMKKGIIVITFNYRLNVFGFFSYNTAAISGNAGLRDQLTLLRWVQRNVRVFGGNPHDVTLAGQSSGAVCAHLLALSKQSKGLFNRVILMSQTALPNMYSPSPAYARIIGDAFLKAVGINTTDTDQIHKQLVNMPLEDIMKANSQVLRNSGSGFESFVPVIEAEYPGVTRIVDDDPINMIKGGRDMEYPIVIGFTNNECETFRNTMMNAKLLDRIKNNPLMVLPVGIAFSTSSNVSSLLANKMMERYIHGDLNFNDYMVLCKNTLFNYPAFQLSRWRSEINAAPTYTYQFTYNTERSVIKETFNLEFEGNGHVEDLVNIFRANAVLGDKRSIMPITSDDHMKNWMTTLFVKFMHCNDPTCGEGWYPVNPNNLNYQSVYYPYVYNNTCPTAEEWEMIRFHDEIDNIAMNSPA